MKHGFDKHLVSVQIHEDLDLDYDTETKQCEIYTEFGTSDDEFGQSLPISVNKAKDMIELLSQYVEAHDEQVESPYKQPKSFKAWIGNILDKLQRMGPKVDYRGGGGGSNSGHQGHCHAYTFNQQSECIGYEPISDGKQCKHFSEVQCRRDLK